MVNAIHNFIWYNHTLNWGCWLSPIYGQVSQIISYPTIASHLTWRPALHWATRPSWRRRCPPRMSAWSRSLFLREVAWLRTHLLCTTLSGSLCLLRRRLLDSKLLSYIDTRLRTNSRVSAPNNITCLQTIIFKRMLAFLRPPSAAIKAARSWQSSVLWQCLPLA